MRKVKKQWVVMSMTTFAVVGAGAYLSGQNHMAKADTTNNSTNSAVTTNTTNPQSGQSSITVTQNTQGSQGTSTNVNNTSSQGNHTTQNQTNNDNQFNNIDESAKYSSQIQQGYQDAFQNKGNQSNMLSGQAANYYNAGYTGAQSALNAYVAKTQGTGAGNQDYNYYGNTVTKQNGYQDDTQNAQVGAKGSSNKRKTAGDNGNAAKTQVSTTTEATNPTNGTPLNYSNPNNINQGGADNPKDASTSVATYESTMSNKVNTANNISVKVTSPTQAINIPTANTDVIVNDRNKYANAIGLRKAFDQGVTYALQQQGIADAESGKWQGVYSGSNGQTKDYYLLSNLNDTNNIYDQAYRGARDAMNAYFNSSNAYQGNTAVQTTTTGTADYQAGYNDVVNQASQGIVYVQNGQQYASVMTGNTIPNTVGGTIANNINTIRLANDVDLTGAVNGENDGTVYTNSATITVDGQNHMMDFHGNNYTINRNGAGSLDVYLQNFQTMYGANYFGAFRAEAGAVFHFSNINYVGPQLLSSYNNDTYFSGNVNVLVPTQSTYYTSPFQSGILIEGSGNQENLEVNNFILEPNSNYFGNTSPALGGTNVVVTGNFTLGENAKMTLIPRGGNGGAATITDGSTWGVWLKNAGASLNINKNASLNIIPQLYNNQKNLFGGAIYSGAPVSININGGTLNYEGYNGISGYYNQPVDIQGSNQTQINVINGGVMQILMDSVPDTTAWNSFNYHQSTYGGLINNVGQGSFNIGSRGNLKVGVTNSDSTYNVPYFGPININSVGSNHAVFLKTSAVPQFQTTTGTSGQGKNGSINAYTVAITQSDGTKQYLYNFTLNSGSNSYTGIDFNGDNKSGNIAGNTLDIADVPAVQFVGPLTKQTNSDGTVTVTGYAKLSNYKELNNQPIFVGVASSNSNPANYNSLTAVPNTNQPDTYSKADPNLYVNTVDTTGYTGGIIPISYTFAKGANTNYIGMRLHYGINSVNSILTPTGYNSTVEGYKAGTNDKVVEDMTNGDMQIANGTTANIQAGINDALSDSINNSSNSKNNEPFATKTNADYLASYSSIQAGYTAFDSSNPNQDYTQLASYINSSSPSAFAQGYREAAYQAGLNDARFNKTTVQGNANYAEAQNQYNQAYQAALNAGPGASTSTIISQNNLPTITSNGTTASAVTTAISDAQGALAFINDEQNADINGAGLAGLNGDKAKINAYNDAEAGYNNALTVSPSSDNPDVSSDKAEEAGFEYGQSLINGGLSSSTPTTTNAHMTNLQAAISGYNAAQAAITKAKATNISIIQRGLKGGSHDKMGTDNYLGDLTAYKSIKFGAYTGLNNQSDRNLNQLEKVGYDAVVVPVATQAGQQSFMNKAGNTPTGVAALSDAGKQAFINAYNQAQTDYNAGQSQGLTDAQANNKASNVPSNIPSSVINSDAYKLGYKGSVDGYADGSLTSAGTQNAKDTKAQPAYNDAYNAAYALGRQTAGGNDYVQYKQPKASDTDYKTGYSQAQQGHDDGYDDAKSTPNPQPTKSSTIPYVTGYKSGVADEQADATNAANDQGYVDGGNDFLNNITRPTTVAQINNKSVQYTTNYFNAFDASQQGFIEAQANKTDNPSQYDDAKQQAAYQAGFQAFSTVQAKLASDSQSETNANANNNKLESVTNDTFKAFMASLRNTGYTNVENNNGNLYKLIANSYNDAQQHYNQAITSAQADKNAKGTDVFSQLAIDEYNAGYNGGTLDANSSAYKAGQADKTNLTNGIQADKTGIPQRTLTSQDTASDAYKAALSDTFGLTNNSKPANASRVWDDAYAKGLADAKNDNVKEVALSAVQKGQSNPFDNTTVHNTLAQSVFNQIQQGYQEGKDANAQPSQPNNVNYMAGFNAANQSNNDFAKAESQNLPASSANESDTYNGAADAINTVNAHGTQSQLAPDGVHSQAYIDAYNKALTQANNAVAKAFSDMSAGKAQDNSSLDTVANKAIYDNAYKADVKGYNAGVSGQSYPVNTLGSDGYTLGQNATAGYNAAVQKVVYSKDTPNAESLTNYTPSVNGLSDAKANKPMTSNDPAYVFAYSQEKAVQNAIADIQGSNTNHQNAPSGTNTDAYNTAYHATVDGYKDGHSNTIANSINKSSDSRPVYTASYDQGLNAGRIQRGADDYTSDKVNNDVYNADSAYKQGVNEASKGFYDGKAKAQPSSNAPSYQAGYVQGSGSADGIKQAQPTDSNDNGLSSDGLNAYYGIKDAYASVNTPNQDAPSTGKNITKNNAYNDAYKNALTDAQNAQQAGIKDFAKQAVPSLNNDMKSDAEGQAYSQTSQGYADAKSGNIDANNTNKAYLAGVKMYNDLTAGEKVAVSNSQKPQNDTQTSAADAIAQAYNDMSTNENGNHSAQPTTNADKANRRVYQDAYNDGINMAKNAINNGAQNFLTNNGLVAGNTVDNKLTNQAYNGADQGFQDGLTNQIKQQGSAYITGNNAGKAVAQAIADQKANTTNNANVTDQTSYSNANIGYQDGLRAIANNQNMPSQNNVAYMTAYNQAKTDANHAYVDGTQQALTNLGKATSANNSYPNASLQQEANNGFNDVTNGFNSVYNNTSLNNPNNANNEGIALAQKAKRATDAIINNTTPENVPDSITTQINVGIQKAQEALASGQTIDPNQVPSDLDNIAGYAYTQAVKAGNDKLNAIEQAKKNVLANDTLNKDALTTEAQNAIINGMNDATLDTPIHANDKYADQNVGQKAYNTGIQMGKNAIQEGIHRQLSGDLPTNGKDTRSQIIDQAMTNTDNGFNEGLTTDKPNSNKVDYMAGFDAAQAVKAAVQHDGKSSAKATASDTASYAIADGAYKDAIAQFNKASDRDELDNSINSSQENPVYNAAFGQAKQAIIDAYQSGKAQYLASPFSPDTSLSPELQAVQKQGYEDKINSFNNKLSGIQWQWAHDSSNAYHPASDDNDTDNFVNKGIDQAVRDNKVDTGNATVDQIITDAYNQAINGNFDDSQVPEIAKNNPQLTNIYKTAIASMKSDYTISQHRIMTMTSGDPVPGKLGQKGFDRAKEIMKDGFDGTPNSDPLFADAYAYGQATKAGFNNVINHANNQNGQTGTPEGYGIVDGTKGAQSALADQGHHNNDNYNQNYNPDTSINYGFQLAYDAVTNLSQTQATAGANAFTNGQNRPTGGSDTDKMAQDAFDKAQLGYENARDDKIDPHNTDASYKAGIQAYQDAQKGIAYAQANKTVPDNASQAEQLAAKATIAGYRQNNNDNPNSPIYNDAYNSALTDDKQQQNAGASDANAQTPTTDKSKLSALQAEAYDKGVDDGTQGYNRAHDQLASDTPNNVSKNAQDAQNGARDAYNDVLNNHTSNIAEQSPVYQNAYNKAKLDAQKDIADGQKAAKQNYQLTDGASAHDKLAKHANDEFMAGYNHQNGNSEDPSFIAGQKAKTDADNAVKAFINNGHSDGSDLQNIAQQALDDAKQNVNNPNHTGDNALAENDVYNQVHQSAVNDLAKGSQAFVDGTHKAEETDAHTNAQQTGYSNAKNAFEAQLQSTTPMSSNIPSVDAGYKAAQAVQALENDKAKGTNTPVSDVNSYNDAKAGYENALKAIQVNNNQPASSDKPNDPVYTKAYNDAIKNAQDAITTGKTDMLNGTNNSANISNPDFKALAETEKANDQQAFNAGINKETNPFNTQNSKDAYALGQAVAQNIQNAVNDQPVSTGHDDLDKVIARAKQAFNQDPNVSNVLNNDDNPIHQVAYKNIINALNKAYQANVRNVIDDKPVDNTTVGKQAQADANKAINAGYKGQTNPTNLANAYQAGKDAKTGFDLGQNSQKADGSASQATRDGNQAVFDAIADKANGKTRDISGQPLTYQLAYNSANTTVGKLLDQASDAFVNGQPRPQGDDSQAKVLQQAYDLAKQGYEEAKTGKADANNTNVSYKAGVQAYADTQKAIAYAQENKDVPENGSNAEKLAAKALLDGFKNNPKTNANNAIYDDIYAIGQTEDAKWQKAGALDTLKDSTSQGLTNLEQASYDNGINKANQAFDTVKGNLNQQVSSADPIVNDTLAGAKAGFDINSNVDLNNKSDIYRAAYQKARTEARDAIKLGRNLGATNQAMPANLDIKSAQYVLMNHARSETISGYNNVNANDTDPSYVYGQSIRNDAHQSFKQFIDGNGVTNEHNRQIIENAIQDALHENNANENNNHDIQDASLYKQVKDAIAEAQKTGAENFVNNVGKGHYSESPILQQAYETGYRLARAGYNDGFENRDHHAGFGYELGYQYAQNIKAGANDAKNHKHDASKALNDTGYQIGYDAYKAGLSDGELGRHRSHTYNDASIARIYEDGYARSEAKAISDATKDVLRGLKHHHMMNENQLRLHSNAYRKAYRAVFKKYEMKFVPQYVYNIANIYIHHGQIFNKDSRRTHFVYTKRRNASVFKVLGLSFNKNGVLRYKVGNGKYITANDKFVKPAYYKHNFKQYRVIKATGAYAHKGKPFTVKNRVYHIKRGELIRVKAVITLGHITRLQLPNGLFVTSNKTFVIKK